MKQQTGNRDVGTKIILVAAMSRNRVIGRQGDLPWHLPEDLKRFMRFTKGKPVIMGRKTFESIGKPLPKRTNIVLTREKSYHIPGVHTAHTIDESITLANANLDESETIIIGGGYEIYRLFLPLASHMRLTHVDIELEGDTFFPPFDRKRWLVENRQAHPADERHAYPFEIVSYISYKRREESVSMLPIDHI